MRIIWNKGTYKGVMLSRFFSTNELKCRCRFKDCFKQEVTTELLDKLDLLREELGQPIKVKSAFRCARHQDSIRASGISTVTAKKFSTHEWGMAADISAKDMKRLKELAPKYFQAIGTASTYIHVDTRGDKKRRWRY